MQYLSPSVIIVDLERLIRGEQPDTPLPILAAHIHRYFAVAFALGHRVEPARDDSGAFLTQVLELEDPRA